MNVNLCVVALKCVIVECVNLTWLSFGYRVNNTKKCLLLVRCLFVLKKPRRKKVTTGDFVQTVPRRRKRMKIAFMLRIVQVGSFKWQAENSSHLFISIYET